VGKKLSPDAATPPPGAVEPPGSHLLVSRADLESLAAGKLPDGIADRAKTTLALLDDPVTQAVREYVRARRVRHGEFEIDDAALVSIGDDNGAYVHGWHWEYLDGTPLDKEADWRSELPGDSQQWDLVTHGAAGAATVEKINTKVIEVIERALARAMIDGRPSQHARAAEQELTEFLGTLPHGAGDTEPRTIMARVVEAAFDEFPELDASLESPPSRPRSTKFFG
jgi:hypothetical protein